ncbi:hypothetical protein AGABI2DRAFT_123389 [Agaricus bisporus var. bisporus H97]|uniref:hypothetical protein n=1 Tax=Agaricus bisporus var. bisporus (strain H97 / ATCC MYA-4626 / FGSC 10389) TaxID=936046 RepID=UPI00029F5EE5|nr:hypothetical protein AGABI2DRAFT_123389 [Agaricus bisporus var. bisporus H97]EKV41917.1 hypothetical protein AGABI2DRAFT_123389 [Agaricus bisporus var. bisporus H97]
MSVTLPIDIWIEIIQYLQYDRLTLVRLSLVSHYLRSIAQPLLFHTINHIAYMSKKTYKKYCLCGQSNHRHVLAYVREFTLDDNCRHYRSWSKRARKRSSSWRSKWFRSKKSQERKLYESLHPGALLPCMINLTTLHIRIRDADSLLDILRHCTETVSVVELSLRYKGCCELDKEELKVIEGFVGRQKGLKKVMLEVGVLEGLGVIMSEDVERVVVSWGQLVVILEAKKNLKRLEFIQIIDGPGPSVVSDSDSRSTSSTDTQGGVTIMADIIQPHHCPRLRYMFLSLDDLIALRLWEDPWKDKLVLLNISSSSNRPWSETKRYLTRFSNLKIVSLTPITISAEDALIHVRHLFTKMPKLEMVIMVGGLNVVYTRRRRRKNNNKNSVGNDSYEDEVFELDYVKDLVKMCDMDVDLGIW